VTARTANHFTTILLGLAILAPWPLIVASIVSGALLLPTVLNLIGAHVGRLTMLRDYRDDNRALKRWGAGTPAVPLLLCLVALAIPQ
jgi:cytochrome bd-type quinol oxidase subunit 2